MITRPKASPALDADTAPEAIDQSTAPRDRVSIRAFALGLLLALGICAITPYNDYFVGATYLSGNFFPIGAIAGVMLVVAVINPILSIVRPESVWRPSEIMTVWIMIAVVAGLPSSGLFRYLIPHIVAPHYFATTTNSWDIRILSHMPSRLFVTDPSAIRPFFEGLHRGEQIPWGAWAMPLGWWGLFTALLFLAFFCCSAILRRQWSENEKFSFPLVQLPIMLAQTPQTGQRFNELLRSPLMWAGAIFVTCIHTIKGLHVIAPSIPDITLAWHSTGVITAAPWSAVNDIEISVFPLVVGFSYFLASDVSLSLWLFYLVYKAQVLIASMHNADLSTTGGGYDQGPAFVVYQEFGGFIAVTLWILISMRPHLRDVWRKAIFNVRDVDDSREPLSYRFALFGLVGAYSGMFAWLTIVAQIAPLMAAGILACSFCIFLVLSWLVSQAGLLFATQSFSPAQMMVGSCGTSSFSIETLAGAALTEHIYWLDPREFMLPSLMNGFHGAGATRLNPRSLTKVLAVSVTAATVVSCAASIWLPYTHGGGTSLKNGFMYMYAPTLPFSWALSKASDVHGPNASALWHMGGGAAFTWLMIGSRMILPPSLTLHPAGFLVADTYAISHLWFSIFLAWVIKTPVLRYGGSKGYNSLRPLFLGLVLGDCVNAVVWCIVGLATGAGYQLLPD